MRIFTRDPQEKASEILKDAWLRREKILSEALEERSRRAKKRIKKIKELKTTVRGLKKKLKELENKHQTLINELEFKRVRISKLEEEVRKKVEEIKNLQIELQEKKALEKENMGLRRRIHWIEKILSRTKIQDIVEFLSFVTRKLRRWKEKIEHLEEEVVSNRISQEQRIENEMEEVIERIEEIKTFLTIQE